MRPTLLHLVGLHDDYQTDGQVITQALTQPNSALAQIAELGQLYQQINSSVGEFATNTLIADSKALASGSASNDSRYANEQTTLADMADHRDRVATLMKATLARAAAGTVPGHGEMQSEIAQARALLKQAAQLAAHTCPARGPAAATYRSRAGSLERGQLRGRQLEVARGEVLDQVRLA